MSLANSLIDGHVPFAHYLSRTVSGWNGLDRGWQAVALGLAVTTLVTVGMPIPW